MNSLTFIAHVIDSLAWPALAAGVLWYLRPHLGGLAARLEEVTFPGIALAKFAKKVEEATVKSEAMAIEQPVADPSPAEPSPEYLALLKQAPELAVIRAYRDLEETLAAIRRQLTPDTKIRTYALGTMRLLAKRGLITESAVELFESLREARNAAAHAEHITRTSAIDFVVSAQILNEVLRRVLNNLPPAPESVSS